MSWLSRAEEEGPRKAGRAFADSRCREIEDRYRGAEHPHVPVEHDPCQEGSGA